jgi:hypothetical protein
MTLIAKLAEVMGEIDHVEKKGTNSAQNYKYVKAADLANIVRQKLAARKVIMLSDVVDVRTYELTTAKGTVMAGIDLKVKYTFYDGDSEAQVSFHGYGSGLDTGDKAAYKAHTGALKYALRNAFLVPDEKGDPEADKKVDEEVNAKPEPFLIRGKVAKVGQKPDDEEVFALIACKDGEYNCFSGVDPNRGKLVDLHESEVEAEFMIMATNRAAKGKPLFSVHNIFPIPTAVPDGKLGPALALSDKIVKESRA